MYNCQLCGVCVGPSIILQVHRIHRKRLDGYSEIAAEIPVCLPCHYLLQQGASVQQVREMHTATKRRATRVVRDNVNLSMTRPGLCFLARSTKPARPARPTTKHAAVPASRHSPKVHRV